MEEGGKEQGRKLWVYTKCVVSVQQHSAAQQRTSLPVDPSALHHHSVMNSCQLQAQAFIIIRKICILDTGTRHQAQAAKKEQKDLYVVTLGNHTVHKHVCTLKFGLYGQSTVVVQ